MPRSFRYKFGNWKAQCDRSGMNFRSSDMVREWNGRYVHKDFAEVRHPQDYAKVVPDHQAVSWSRPEQSVTSTTAYGVGNWVVGQTNVVAPSGLDPETDPVGFETWLNTTYTDIISGRS